MVFRFVTNPLSVLASTLSMLVDILLTLLRGGLPTELTGNYEQIKAALDNKNSEYSVGRDQSTCDTMATIWRLLVPSLNIKKHWIYEWIPFSWFIFGDFAEVTESKRFNKFPKERWIYINGMATTTNVARGNVRMLEEIFDRPVDLIYNPTNSVLVDLWECYVEQQFFIRQFVTDLLFDEVLKRLKLDDVDKVVLICHSQGTIITADMLRHFPKNINCDKLEVYALANCAKSMRYVHAAKQKPYIESIGNTQDLVAQFGMFNQSPTVTIDGLRFVNHTKQGHFLGVSYLDDFRVNNVEYTNKGGKKSKLYSYLAANN